MPTHTPGPWGIVSRFVGPLYIVAEVSTEIDKSGQMEVAHVGAETFATAQANAQLISAAPEMLEALEIIVAGRFEWETSLDIARAAIAKARGTT